MAEGKAKSKAIKHPLPVKPVSADDSKKYASIASDERLTQAFSKRSLTQNTYKSLKWR